jgi:hypothetical protein
VREWPPIDDPELLGRIGLGDAQFTAIMGEFWKKAGSRDFQSSALDRALGYPWDRPAASYILRGEEVQTLDELDPQERASTVRRLTEDRHPLLSFGGNGAPSWLTQKFAHFPDEVDRTVLVLTGELHDFDVGAAASLAPFGYMPATLFASPGTMVRAAIVWTTAAQVTQLTWSEIPYRFGRLDDAHFAIDEADVAIDQIFAYVHRLGSFCIDGSPVALTAIPATNRTATAMTQEQLLDVAANLVLGPDARAEELVRAIFEDMAGTTAKASETIWPSSLQLQARWTQFPVSGTSG